MKLIDLIEYISIPDETGLLTIKPLTHIEFKSLSSVIICEVDSANEKYNGPVFFGDGTWRESSTDSFCFDELTSSFEYEIKATNLLDTRSQNESSAGAVSVSASEYFIQPRYISFRLQYSL